MRLRAVCNLLPAVADARRQLALDKRVNIFGIGVNVQSARLDVLFDFLKLRADLFAFAFVDDSRRAEHCGMRMLPSMSSLYMRLSIEIDELKSFVFGSASFWKRPFHNFMAESFLPVYGRKGQAMNAYPKSTFGLFIFGLCLQVWHKP